MIADDSGTEIETGLDLPAITRFLDAALPEGLAGPLQARLLAGGRSNPTYELDDGAHQWVLRRPPSGGVLQSAHDMTRESRVISALQGSSVPVPAVVAACSDASVLDAPFYVMEKLDGRTFRTREDTATLTPEQRRALSASIVDTLVSLHEVDPVSVALGDFGRPVGYLERQLARWVRQWDAVATRRTSAVVDLAQRLERSLPELRFPGIVHGDYKIDNLMVDHDDPARIIGVLDWEMSTLGDTLADLGHLISFWDEPGGLHNPITAGTTAQPGFPSAAEIVETYAERRSIEVAAIEWYVVFADFKLAVILEQIHARYLAGQTVGNWFDDIGDMVEPLLARALGRASAADDLRLRN